MDLSHFLKRYRFCNKKDKDDLTPYCTDFNRHGHLDLFHVNGFDATVFLGARGHGVIDVYVCSVPVLEFVILHLCAVAGDHNMALDTENDVEQLFVLLGRHCKFVGILGADNFGEIGWVEVE